MGFVAPRKAAEEQRSEAAAAGDDAERFTASAADPVETDADAQTESDTRQVQNPFGNDEAHVEEQISSGYERQNEQAEGE